MSQYTIDLVILKCRNNKPLATLSFDVKKKKQRKIPCKLSKSDPLERYSSTRSTRSNLKHTL